ncbi:MAG TPA: sigma 54-interacting transcriptional regulator [Blastocatellia bacterium]
MGIRDIARGGRIEDTVVDGQTALENGRFEEAVEHFRSALRLGPRNAEEEALIRCELSNALGKRGLGREQLEAIGKYEKPSELIHLAGRTKMLTLIRLGWAHSFNNSVPRAIGFFNQAMRIARDVSDDASIGACYFGLGRAYRNLNEVRIARDHYVSALSHYRKVGNWRELAESYVNIGYINAFEGNYRNALQSLRQALTIIGDRNEHDLLGRAYMYLAITHDNLGSLDKALSCWETCIDCFRQAGNVLYQAINENNMAVKLIWTGEWARAEQLAASAIAKLKSTTGVASFGGALDTMAQLQLLRGNFEQTEQLLNESLKILSSVKTGEWVEVISLTTLGRLHLARNQPELALPPLARAVEMCLRSGTQIYLTDARLCLADAALRTGDLARARELAEAARSELRANPNMEAWGMMMRMVSRIEAADGHLAAAIQSLGQSTSIFELRKNKYGVAVNQIVRAKVFQTQGKISEAASEAQAALEIFQKLGAVKDVESVTAYADEIASSNQEQTTLSPGAGQPRHAGLVSALDGFIARRLVQASVYRELLIYELASVVHSEAAARAVAIVSVGADGLRLEASIGLSETEQHRELSFLSSLPIARQQGSHVYAFTDNDQCNYLMHLIDPAAPRFLAGAINMQPLLYLAEQGLEVAALRSKKAHTEVFDPSQLLSQVELPGFVCSSRAMNRVLEQIHKIRSSDVTVLITGESGTGKELVARAVHAGSSRRSGVFLPFNCSAAPRDMIESQLFGHKKGAFTGASSSYEGVVRAAERGSLFLDEIGDLPLELQPKLLRFLQEGEIHPLGEPRPLRIDVRVIAATNSDLEKTVSEGRFREDLFHRINVIRIHIPPLRERREEIPALINHYLNQYQEEAAKNDLRLSEQTVDLMMVYDWPGNVRQLCNEIRRIVTYSDSGSIVTADALSTEISRIRREFEDTPTRKSSYSSDTSLMTPPPGTTLPDAMVELERYMIREALKRTGGNVAHAAKDLGLSRKGLYLKMDRLNFNN